MRSPSRLTQAVAIVLAATLAVLMAGSLLYGVSDGTTRSPEGFRQLVASRGLEVDWSNNGPRAGEGTVTADCGTVGVSVNEQDDALWVQRGDQRAIITPAVVSQLQECASELGGG